MKYAEHLQALQHDYERMERHLGEIRSASFDSSLLWVFLSVLLLLLSGLVGLTVWLL